MSSYEYTVIPAPMRSDKTKGARTGIDRFAATLTEVLNQMARDGWDYVRAETLPAEERSGLTSRNTVYHNLLVFRRSLAPETPLRAQQPLATTPDPAPTQPTQPAPTPPEPVRGPFSQPMRAMPKQQPQARSPDYRNAEPPLTAGPAPAQGPRLGPATR